MSVEGLQQRPMTHHLLEMLDRGEDIDPYGRLAFAIVPHHFAERDELVEWLSNDGATPTRMRPARWPSRPRRGLQPPRWERILGRQEQQDFSIYPNPDDPDACNVYSELQLPDEVYQDIEECQKKTTPDF